MVGRLVSAAQDQAPEQAWEAGISSSNRSDRLQEAALAYARSGWPVFPTRPDDPTCATPGSCSCKAPLTRHGLDDASTDPATISRFWTGYPGANVAIATGGPAPVVLDVDIAHGRPGFQALNEAIRAGLIPQPMAATRTPSGGLHLYYASTPGQRNGSLPEQGLDWRAERGYVLAPPSTVHGKPYVLDFHGRTPATIDFARLRDHFQPRLQPGLRQRDHLDAGRLAGWVARLRPGNRNSGLWWAAWRAAQAGDRAAISQIAEAGLSTGLTQREIDRIVASAMRIATHPKEPGQREAR